MGEIEKVERGSEEELKKRKKTGTNPMVVQLIATSSRSKPSQTVHARELRGKTRKGEGKKRQERYKDAGKQELTSVWSQ